MKIILHEDVKLEWADVEARRRNRPVHPDLTVESTGQGRSKGVHLSGVLRAYALNAEILTPSELDEESETVFPLRMAMGIAWEELLASMMPETHWWPGELKRDGIAGNPDGISRGVASMTPEGFDDTLVIEETKYTQKSCGNGRDMPGLQDRQAVKDYWMWLHQVQGYCCLHPDRPRHARLHVLYTCGDYQRPFKERYLRTLIEFNQRELDATWELIVRNKHRARPE